MAGRKGGELVVYCNGSLREGLLHKAKRVKEAMDVEGGEEKGTIWVVRTGGKSGIGDEGRRKSGYGKENGMEATVQLPEKSEDGLKIRDIGKRYIA
jgi:hypothetical protein